MELPCRRTVAEVGVEAGYPRTPLLDEPTAEAVPVAVACPPDVEVALLRGESEVMAC